MHRRRLLAGLAAMVPLAFTALGAQAELRYRVQELSYDGYYSDRDYLSVSAFNNRGVVVGDYQESDFTDEGWQTRNTAYVSRGTRLEALPGTGAFVNSWTRGINDQGQIIGEYYLPDGKGQVPYLYTNGQYRDLRVENQGNWDYARSINASGQVVGRANDKAFFFDGTRSRYIDIPGAVASHAEALNDHGTVVGYAVFDAPGGGYDERSFVYGKQGLEFVDKPTPSSIDLALVDINNAGQMIANVRDRDTRIYQSFIYEADGRPIELGSLNPDQASTQVFAMNNQGWAVGQSLSTACSMYTCSEGFLWRDGRMTGLSGLVLPSQAQGWHFAQALDINDRGQILGTGLHDELYATFVLTPVPEPGSWALLLAGLGAVGTAARRRATGRG